MLDRSFHIISISETWLRSFISDDLISFNNYFLIRNDRQGREGGGVACYIHNSLKAKVLAASPSLYSNSPKYLLMKISGATSEKLLVVSVYRHPGALMFVDFLYDYSKISHAYQNIVLAGDLIVG